MGTLLPSGDPDTWNLGHINELLINVAKFALVFAGGIAMIYLIFGAFQYFTAYGNEERATKAKNTILWAIVGLVVILIGELIVQEVWNLFSDTGIVFPDFQ